MEEFYVELTHLIGAKFLALKVVDNVRNWLPVDYQLHRLYKKDGQICHVWKEVPLTCILSTFYGELVSGLTDYIVHNVSYGRNKSKIYIKEGFT